MEGMYMSLFLNWVETHSNLLGERPQRSTRGKGGARAQLEAVANLIRPDLTGSSGVKRPRTKEIPKDVPVNSMAPQTKRRRGVCILIDFHCHGFTNKIIKGETIADPSDPLPTIDDPPLILDAPKPSFADSHSHSTFGFQATAQWQDMDLADDIYEDYVDDDANKMDEDADIGEEKDIDGGKFDIIHPFFNAFILPELEPEVNTIQDSEGSSIILFIYWSKFILDPIRVIDEQSPDEDDRLALQFLRGSKGVVPHDKDDQDDRVADSGNHYSWNNIMRYWLRWLPGPESEPEFQPPRRLKRLAQRRFISSGKLQNWCVMQISFCSWAASGSPKQKFNVLFFTTDVVNTDDEPDEDSHEVLDVYHRKNKVIKPPPSSSNLRSLSGIYL